MFLFAAPQRPWRPTSGTERVLHILRASLSEISVCLGTVSTAAVRGFVHKEWLPPSRLR
jgi:hypothetical protein